MGEIIDNLSNAGGALMRDVRALGNRDRERVVGEPRNAEPRVIEMDRRAVRSSPAARAALGIEEDSTDIGALEDGYIDQTELEELGWSVALFNQLKGIDNRVSYQEFMMWIDEVNYEAEQFGVSPGEIALIHMRATSFDPQKYASIGSARQDMQDNIETNMQVQMKADRNLTEAQAFLMAIQDPDLGYVGVNGEVLREMQAFIGDDPAPSDKTRAQLFEHFFGLILRSREPATFQRQRGVVTARSDGDYAGMGITSSWNAVADDYESWFRGDTATIRQGGTSEVSAMLSLRYLQRRLQFTGELLILQNLMQTGSLDLMYNAVYSYINQLKELLAAHHGSMVIGTEINKVFGQFLSSLFQSESGQDGQRTNSALLGTLLSTNPDGTLNDTRLNSVLRAVEDYATFLMGFPRLLTPETLNKVSQYYGAISGALINAASTSMGEFRTTILPLAEDVLNRSERIIERIEQTDAGRGSAFTEQARATLAFSWIQLAGAYPKEDDGSWSNQDRCLLRAFEVIGVIPPDSNIEVNDYYTILVYLKAINMLWSAGRPGLATRMLANGLDVPERHEVTAGIKKFENIDGHTISVNYGREISGVGEVRIGDTVIPPMPDFRGNENLVLTSDQRENIMRQLSPYLQDAGQKTDWRGMTGEGWAALGNGGSVYFPAMQQLARLRIVTLPPDNPRNVSRYRGRRRRDNGTPDETSSTVENGMQPGGLGGQKPAGGR